MIKSVLVFLIIIFSTTSQAAAKNNLTDAEVLSTAYDYSQQQIELSRFARGKLEDMQLRSINDRLLEDHKVMARTLDDLAKDQKYKISHGILGKDTDFIKLRSLSGKRFDAAFLRKSVELQEAYLKTLNQTLIPESESAYLKEVLKNFKPKLNKFQDNAKAQKGNLSKETL